MRVPPVLLRLLPTARVLLFSSSTPPLIAPPSPKVILPPVEEIVVPVLMLGVPIMVKSAACVSNVPADDSQSVLAEPSVKSVVAEPSVIL